MVTGNIFSTVYFLGLNFFKHIELKNGFWCRNYEEYEFL